MIRRLNEMEVGGKKLLILHLKGFLIDCYHDTRKRPSRSYDAKINHFYVYRRPGFEEFVQFCLDNFIVGVWSSAHERNVMALVKYIFGEAEKKLAFIWSKNKCTESGLGHPNNLEKPLVWKELSRLWNEQRGLPWEKGAFGPSNTILVDDDRYAIEKNPSNTAIILETYCVTEPDDNYLGKLRTYLEEVADTQDVQQFIEENPFGKLCDDDLSLSGLSIKDKPESPRTVSLNSGVSRQTPCVAALLSALSDAEICEQKKRGSSTKRDAGC